MAILRSPSAMSTSVTSLAAIISMRCRTSAIRPSEAVAAFRFAEALAVEVVFLREVAEVFFAALLREEDFVAPFFTDRLRVAEDVAVRLAMAYFPCNRIASNVVGSELSFLRPSDVTRTSSSIRTPPRPGR